MEKYIFYLAAVVSFCITIIIITLIVLKFKQKKMINIHENNDNDSNNVIEIINKDIYKDLIDRQEWKDKKEQILERDGHKCKWCGSTHNLQVHHKCYFKYPNETYVEPWKYPDDVLITLCDNCHKKAHKQYTELKTYYRSFDDKKFNKAVEKFNTSSFKFNNYIPERIKNIIDTMMTSVEYRNLEIVFNGDTNEFEKIKESQREIVSSFIKNNKNTDISILTTEQYFQLLSEGGDFNSLTNEKKKEFYTKHGTFIIVNKENEVLCKIRLTVYSKYYGAIMLGEILNFTDGYYLSIHKDEEKYKIISNNDLYKNCVKYKDLLTPPPTWAKNKGYSVEWEGETLLSEYYVKGSKLEKFE